MGKCFEKNILQFSHLYKEKCALLSFLSCFNKAERGFLFSKFCLCLNFCFLITKKYGRHTLSQALEDFTKFDLDFVSNDFQTINGLP